MDHSSGPFAGDAEQAVRTYGPMLYKLCFVMLANAEDAEDAVQDTMLQYLRRKPAFESAGHEKAWLLTVAGNRCRDMLRFRLRHPKVTLEELNACTEEQEDTGILAALMTLPEPYRLVMTLRYVEGYTAEAIAPIIQRTPSAVRMRLQKGRELLKEAYRKEYLENE